METREGDIETGEGDMGTKEGDMEMGGTDEYVESYGNPEVHKVMLKDKPRVDAYAHAILANKEWLKDKVIMDVGSGSGILSLLLLRLTEVRHVYAVEANPLMCGIIEKMARHNSLESKLTILNEKIEHLIALSPQERGFGDVDGIISEWMGHYLLHESMLDSVLLARDHFLPPDGTGRVFPDKATIYASLVSCPEIAYEHCGWIRDEPRFFGLDLTPLEDFLLPSSASLVVAQLPPSAVSSVIETARHMKETARHMKETARDMKETARDMKETARDMKETAGDGRRHEGDMGRHEGDMSLFSSKTVVAELDLMSVTHETLDAIEVSKLELVLHRPPPSGTIDGLAVYFDVSFGTSRHGDTETRRHGDMETRGGDRDMAIVLPTGPIDPPTHWKQTVLLFDSGLPVDESMCVEADLSISRQHREDRQYDLNFCVTNVISL